MNVEILCNSYPTIKNPHNQIFIENIKNRIESKDVNVGVTYNGIYDIWGDANSHKGVFANLLKYGFFLFSLMKFVIKRGRKTDIIFSHAVIFPTTFAVLLKKLLNIPVVCYVHGGDINTYPFSGNVYKKIMKYSLDNSNYIIVNSKDILNKVNKITDKRNVQIVSPGVDTSVMKKIGEIDDIKSKLEIPKDKFIVISAGNAIKRKGFDILIKGIKELNDQILRKIYIVILTEGPEKQNLKKLITKFDLEDIVELRAKVDQYTLNKYYNLADLFVFPSRDEPLGLVGIEAMSAGTLVIGSNVGGIKEYIDDKNNGLLFEVGNYKELSEIISDVYLNKNNYKDTYKNATITAEKHSIKSSTNEIIKIFESTINLS